MREEEMEPKDFLVSELWAEKERERKAVRYWRTEYLRVQRERDEWRRIACEDDDDKPALPQREGDYL